MENPITLTAHCLCKANIFEAQVARSKLPLPAHTCHCDSCRHVTGAMYSSYLSWPKPRADVDVSKLKVFHFFPSTDLLFCPTCSTPMFWADTKDKDCLLGVFTGTLRNDSVDLVKFPGHIFVHDTLDGGASVWLGHNADGSEVKRFKFHAESNDSGQLPDDWPPTSALTGYETKREDSVPIRCKCKGVDLVVHLGDYSKKKEHELPFNIDPKTYKLLAGFCACDSCRLQGGIDVFNWTFADLKHISFGNSDKPFPTTAPDLRSLVDSKDPVFGTLTYYASSQGVERYFCSNCSACIFYTHDSRPAFVDIAIGVLEASDGARAEGVLSWTYGGKISHREDGEGGWREKLFDNVEKDAEEFRVATGYPKNWARVLKDNNGGASPQWSTFKD